MTGSISCASAPSSDLLSPRCSATVDDEDTAATAMHAKDRKTMQAEIFSGAEAGHVETIRSLIACNVDVNFCHAPHGATPLYAASQCGHYDMVRLLLKHGADPNIRRADDGGTVSGRGTGFPVFTKK